MKLNKLFMAIVGASLLASCSSSDDNDQKFTWNTAPNVTVEMGETEVTVKENASRFTIPVVVSGEPNGYVQVTFDIVEHGAIEDVNFIITTKTLNINSDDKVAYLEVAPVDFVDENPLISFDIDIKDVKGASIGAVAQTVVFIKDKGQSPTLDKLDGAEWLCSYVDYDGNEATFNSQLVVDDVETGACHLAAFAGEDIFELPMIYEYDANVRYGEFVINNGTIVGKDINFNNIGISDVQIGNASGNVSVEQRYIGSWNDDYSEVSWDGTTFMLMITKNGASTGYLFDGVTNLKMVKL